MQISSLDGTHRHVETAIRIGRANWKPAADLREESFSALKPTLSSAHVLTLIFSTSFYPLSRWAASGFPSFASFGDSYQSSLFRLRISATFSLRVEERQLKSSGS